MMISVRSYLAAGTAAVVGASAIALTPVLPAQGLSAADLPAPAIAEIALTGVTLPLTDIIGVLQTLGGLGGSLTGVLGGFLPQQFINDVVAEVLTQAAPLMTAAAGEVFGYLGPALSGLLFGPDSIPARVGAAVGNIPAVLGTAVEALSTGDIAAAVQSVTTGLAAPLTAVGQTLADASQAFQDFLSTRLDSVVGALPGILLSAIQTVFGDTVQATLDTITDALSGLFGGLLPAASTLGIPSAAAAIVVADGPAVARSVDVSPQSVTQVPSSPAGDSRSVADPADVESPAAGAESAVPNVESAAPVARPRAVAKPPAPAESAAAGPAVATRSTPTLRARTAAERPSVSRAARTAG